MSGLDSLIDPSVSGSQQDLTTEQLRAMRDALLRAHPGLAVDEPRPQHNQKPNRRERRAAGAKKRRGK